MSFDVSLDLTANFKLYRNEVLNQPPLPEENSKTPYHSYFESYSVNNMTSNQYKKVAYTSTVICLYTH